MGRVWLLDGGFSTQLTHHVGPVIDGDPLWTARFLATDNAKCIAAHRDFIRAGANIIESASYQASVDGFKRHLNLEREQALAVIKDSITIAKEAIHLEELARGGNKRDILVAGSVGPYGAILPNGSEYRGDYGDNMTKEELKEWHRPRITALIEAGADLLAFETIPCSVEAIALIEILKEYPNCKAWLSFTVKDSERISNGDIFKDIAEKCWDMGCKQLVAIGVNCLHPSLVTPILNSLKISSPHIPLIAYPNSGEMYDGTNKKWINKKGDPNIAEYVREWLDMGISYIGGCCRISDKEIQQVSEVIQKWEKKNP